MARCRSVLLTLALVCASVLHPAGADVDERAAVARLARVAAAGDVRATRAALAALAPATLDAHGGDVLLRLLAAWQQHVEEWPDAPPAPRHAEVLSEVLRAPGVNASSSCAVLDAIATRNAPAFAALWAASSDAGATFCLTAQDANGQGLLAHAVMSSAAGMARLLFRLRARQGALPPPTAAAAAAAPPVSPAEAADVRALVAHLAMDALPPWSPRATLRRADVERALGTAFVRGLLDEARRRGLPTADLVDMTDAAGATPLTTACAQGRAVAVAALLAAGADPALVAAPASEAVFGGGGGAGWTCGHAAASHGYLGVLAAVEAAAADADAAGNGARARAVRAVISLRDARGRTPFDIAAAHGAPLAHVATWLAARGAAVTRAAGSGAAARRVDDDATPPPALPASAPAGSALLHVQPRAPPAVAMQQSRGTGAVDDARPPAPPVDAQSPTPPVDVWRCPPAVLMHAARSPGDPSGLLAVFNLTAHIAAGWRAGSAAELRAAGLPPTLFEPRALRAVADDAAADVSAFVNAAAALARVAAVATGPPADGACGVDVVVTSSRAGSPLTRAEEARITDDYLSVGRPFILRRRRRQQRRAAGDGGGAAAPLARAAFIDAFGSLPVSVGDVPYASSYAVGNGSVRMTLAQFVQAHMPPPPPVGDGAERDDARAAVDAAAADDDVAPRPLPRPPYVFDGAVMHATAAAAARVAHMRRTAPARAPAADAAADPFAAYDPPPVFGKARGAGPGRQLRQLMLGPAWSGAMPHFHGAAVNTLVFGAKLWVLRVPEDAEFAQAHAADWFTGAYAEQVREWGAQWRRDPAAAPPPHLRFVQEPGDVVFVPQAWGHAVLNLADSLAFALE